MSLLVGSIAFDTIINIHGKRERIIGGSSTYFAYATSLFTETKLVGIVGTDFPQKILDEMQSKGIDTKGIEIKNGKTFFWEGEYSQDFLTRKTITTELNVFENFNPIIPEDYKKEKNVFLANIDPKLQKSVIEQVGKDKFIVMDTMNLWINNSKSEVIKAIKDVNGLIINDEEAFLISDKDTIFHAARYLNNLGPDIIIIKKGEHGCLALYKDDFYILPPFPVEKVIDPTGAGDSFAGGFMGYLDNNSKINETNLKRALVYGTIISSFAIEDFGVEKLRNLTKNDFNKRLEKYRDMIKY